MKLLHGFIFIALSITLKTAVGLPQGDDDLGEEPNIVLPQGDDDVGEEPDVALPSDALEMSVPLRPGKLSLVNCFQ